VADLHHGQASPDGASRVPRNQREAAESVAVGDQLGPVRVVERRRNGMPRHKAPPAGVGQVQNRYTTGHSTMLSRLLDPRCPFLT
jgi:hypothetical protein